MTWRCHAEFLTCALRGAERPTMGPYLPGTIT